MENYLRSYGGFVETKDPKFDKTGSFQITFSRPIIFPQKLIAEYDSNYIEKVPILAPTEAELEEIRKVFE